MSTLMSSQPSEKAKSISLSNCPVFPTHALFFKFFMWSKEMMLELPVEETNKSITDMTVSTWTPSSTPAGRRRGYSWQMTYEVRFLSKKFPERPRKSTASTKKPSIKDGVFIAFPSTVCPHNAQTATGGHKDSPMLRNNHQGAIGCKSHFRRTQ